MLVAIGGEEMPLQFGVRYFLNCKSSIVLAFVATLICNNMPMCAETVGFTALPADGPYFPFAQYPSASFQRLMDPRHSDVSMIINDMPVGYKKSFRGVGDTDLNQLQEQLEEALQTALSLSRNDPILLAISYPNCPAVRQIQIIKSLGNPRLEAKLNSYGTVNFFFTPADFKRESQTLLVDILGGLACVQLRKGNYIAAEDYLRRAVMEEKEIKGPASLDLVALYNAMAQIARLNKDYDSAIIYYLNAIDICKVSADKSPLLASEYVQVANTYSDKMQSSKSKEFEKLASDILGGWSGVGSSISRHGRPIPTSIAGAMFNEWASLSSKSSDAESLKNQRRAEISQMETLVKGVLSNACTEVKPASGELLCLVRGVLKVPKDKAPVTETIASATATNTTFNGENKTVSISKPSETKEDVRGQLIYILDKTSAVIVDEGLREFAKSYGLSESELGNNWPGVYVEAEEALQNVVSRIKPSVVQSTETGGNGDFKFADKLPAGTYYLFSAIGNRDKVLYWLIEFRVVSNRRKLFYLTEANARLLWPLEVKDDATATRQPFSMPIDAKQRKGASAGEIPAGLVPPPPPDVP